MEEQRYAAEHAHDHDDDVDSGVKKSPSEFSCGSADVYIPPSKHNHPGEDKERISIKSECMVDGVRRLSIVNSRGKKVRRHFFVVYIVLTLSSGITLGPTYNEFSNYEDPGATCK